MTSSVRERRSSSRTTSTPERRRAMCTHKLKTNGVCKRTNERPTLSRGVCVPPPASPRPPPPPTWHMIFHIAAGHTQAARVRANRARLCVREQKRVLSPSLSAPADSRAGRRSGRGGDGWTFVTSRGLHGYIISQGYQQVAISRAVHSRLQIVRGVV